MLIKSKLGDVPSHVWFSRAKKVWRTCEGFSNYEVSNFGDVRRSIHKNPKGGGWRQKRPGDELKVCFGKLYPYVHIVNDDGVLKTKRVSNLVCTAPFGHPPLDKPNALHKNDNPGDNHSSNLYWGTQKQNIDDAKANGYCQLGELGPNSKFTNEEAKDIRDRYAAGGTTFQKLADEFGVTYSTTRNICISKTYKGK